MIDVYKFDLKEENASDEPLLITINEACKILNIGRIKLLELSRLKGFPALIFPHKILIDKNQLPIWLSKNYGNYKN